MKKAAADRNMIRWIAARYNCKKGWIDNDL